MYPSAFALLAICLLCTACSPAPSRAAPTASRDDQALKAKYREIQRFNMRGLVEATLTKSKDLAQKGLNTYFCTYHPDVQPKACDRMDTVSGQYEDFYQSQMACKERCERARITQSSWDYIRGTKRICKELATGSCEKLALTPDQMREELRGLLELEQQMKFEPAPLAPDPAPASEANERQ
jgi:hypothetical protein